MTRQPDKLAPPSEGAAGWRQRSARSAWTGAPAPSRDLDPGLVTVLGSARDDGPAHGPRRKGVAMPVTSEDTTRASSKGLARTGTAERLTRADRVVRGKDARALAPLESHAQFAPDASRDPVGLLLEQAKSRVPELVPVRHGRMLVSPFAFFRGAALPMAADLATTPASGLRVQLCGDAHLSNFGAFASPERRLVFDVNDFDETLPGPFEWDVERQARRAHHQPGPAKRQSRHSRSS